MNRQPKVALLESNNENTDHKDDQSVTRENRSRE